MWARWDRGVGSGGGCQVHQMLMGGGKTCVISPLSAALLSTPKQLFVAVVPPSLPLGSIQAGQTHLVWRHTHLCCAKASYSLCLSLSCSHLSVPVFAPHGRASGERRPSGSGAAPVRAASERCGFETIVAAVCGEE